MNIVAKCLLNNCYEVPIQELESKFRENLKMKIKMLYMT